MARGIAACIKANRSPNPLQVLRFLDYAEVVLADIPFGLGWLLNVVVGKSIVSRSPSRRGCSRLNVAVTGRVLGGYIAGYGTRYPEFEVASKKQD